MLLLLKKALPNTRYRFKKVVYIEELFFPGFRLIFRLHTQKLTLKPKNIYQTSCETLGALGVSDIEKSFPKYPAQIKKSCLHSRTLIPRLWAKYLHHNNTKTKALKCVLQPNQRRQRKGTEQFQVTCCTTIYNSFVRSTITAMAACITDTAHVN